MTVDNYFKKQNNNIKILDIKGQLSITRDTKEHKHKKFGGYSVKTTVSDTITGNILRNNGVNKKAGSEIAGLVGGLSAILTGALTGLNEEEISSNVFNGQRLGKNAVENNVYFANRPLEGSPKVLKSVLDVLDKVGVLSPLFFTDFLSIELEHEQLFFEDEIGGNIGFFNDNTVRADNEENLKLYRRSNDPQDGWYDDAILREAVKNVKPKSYNLLGDKQNEKYNCQDYVDDVRKEYSKILKKRVRKNLKNNPLVKTTKLLNNN